MANEEHLKILKQGVEVWNRWREGNAGVQPYLGEANLSGANLSGANLSDAMLNLAVLTGAKLSRVNFSRVNLSRAHLNVADLSLADLSLADLSLANLSLANLSLANLSRVKVRFTVFASLDLSTVKGLETIQHEGPSSIGIDTITRSRGKIPKEFLRGCGLSDWEIEAAKLYQSGLCNEEINDILYKVHDLRAHRSIQISSLFISYSHADSVFVDHMEGFLNRKGIRFWRDVHHATAGRLEKQIDHAIRHNPTVLLILSEHSTESDWVEHEARLARKLEEQLGRDVLCPVALDDSWKTCRWPERLREQIIEYNILDFSNWQDETYFRRMFARLIEGLDLFYKE